MSLSLAQILNKIFDADTGALKIKKLKTISAYTETGDIAATDEVVEGTGTITLTLPLASAANKGKVFHLMNVGTGTVTWGGKINGATNFASATQYECITVYSSGVEATGYRIIS